MQKFPNSERIDFRLASASGHRSCYRYVQLDTRILHQFPLDFQSEADATGRVCTILIGLGFAVRWEPGASGKDGENSRQQPAKCAEWNSLVLGTGWRMDHSRPGLGEHARCMKLKANGIPPLLTAWNGTPGSSLSAESGECPQKLPWLGEVPTIGETMKGRAAHFNQHLQG